MLVNRWDRQALSTLTNTLTSADIFQQGMGASELGQCQHQAGGSGGVGQSYTIYIQSFQVIGEREISGVLRITEQTSSLTPKNR